MYIWIWTDKDGEKLRQSWLEIEFQIETNLIFLCDGIKYIFKYLSSFFFFRNTDQIFIFWVDDSTFYATIFFLFDVYIYSRNYCYARSVFMESDKLAVPRINSCIGRFNLSDQFFFFFLLLFFIFIYSIFFSFFLLLLSILIPADYPIVRSSLYRYALTTIC